MIGKILARLAKGDQLSRMEEGKLEAWGNNTETNASYVGGLQTGQADVNIRKLNALSADFVIPPLESVYLVNTASLTCTNGAAKDITFETRTEYPPSPFYSWSSGNAERISFPLMTTRADLQFSKLFLITGVVRFASNASGYREVYLDAVTGSGTTSYRLNNKNAVNGEVTEVEISYPMVITDLSLQYIKFSAIQNSGGDLNLTNAKILITRIG